MPKCTVYIDDQLPTNELQMLLNAIAMFRGVQEVTLEDGGSVNFNQSPNLKADNTQSSTDDLLDPETQRYFIDEVIKWAVKSKQLHLEDVRSWSPEEIVSHAVRIFESMSEPQKSLIGKKVSEHAERQFINPRR